MKFRIFCSAALCAAAMAAGVFQPVWLLIAAGNLLWLLGLALNAAEDSQRDALTGLKNLRGLSRDRQKWEKTAQLAVLYFDLDHLKQINDTQGHGQGNEALVQMGQALQQAAGGHADPYRVGGDEFLLICSRSDVGAFQARWENISHSQGLPSLSLGTAMGPGEELDTLIQQAEQEMYRSRK